ncbi:putative DCC family thiol-disulfide oxidoreductase YuxK [Halopolyspora algeriensis]|uniref:Putative DCC family thiol-disulfide oxidoreductase YuxK n=1 Tax=Halopolyspora algeriensis TaxID=1500506 RepID=A0A368VSB1_9ACTN|nr:DUF393 domain-containing protein [Halopolyspora algeriensis]RCW43742.1 putative DCC family thiol-disulfide oxidoreductase YuxK [Halopolyspora algeriensis]TQM47475.1 putative DCC family thiol-disulfide oxidoreductase YuxK [Halopolyspora algeriensis]
MSDGSGRPELPVLVYDGDCGFCTGSARLVERLPVRVRLAPWQEEDLTALRTTEERARHEVLWVDSAGHVFGGGMAVAELLKHCRGPWKVLGRVLAAPGIRTVVDGVYRRVSANRQHLSFATPACRLPENQRPGARRG